VVERLQDDRGAAGELLRDTACVGGAREPAGLPGQVDRVIGGLQSRTCLDQPEAGRAQAARADEALDVRL
jgi:hypothetical protein